MRKCAFCGTDNADGEIFCGMCGQRLDNIPNEPNDDKSAEMSEKPVEECSPETALTPKSTFCPLCCGSGEIVHVYRADIALKNQEHINKIREMLSELSDDEITIQIESIVEWAERYKELLLDELLQRGHDVQDVQGESAVPSDEYTDEDDAFYAVEELDEDASHAEIVIDETIDYNLAQMIQQKVAAFSVAETEEALQKLKSIPEYMLSAEELAQLHYEIDTCELHLFELTGDVNG